VKWAGADAVKFGNRVYCASDCGDSPGAQGNALIFHEAVYTQQQQSDGGLFWLKYGVDYVVNEYCGVGYEIEAYKVAGSCGG
jgi:hypothetical protein